MPERIRWARSEPGDWLPRALSLLNISPRHLQSRVPSATAGLGSPLGVLLVSDYPRSPNAPRPPRWPITGAVAVVTSLALIGVAPMTADGAPSTPADGAVQMASRVSAAPLQTEALAPGADQPAGGGVQCPHLPRRSRYLAALAAPGVSVAQEIKSRDPGVVAIQELGPGPGRRQEGQDRGRAPADREPGESAEERGRRQVPGRPGHRRTSSRGSRPAPRADACSTTPVATG